MNSEDIKRLREISFFTKDLGGVEKERIYLSYLLRGHRETREKTLEEIAGRGLDVDHFLQGGAFYGDPTDTATEVHQKDVGELLWISETLKVLASSEQGILDCEENLAHLGSRRREILKTLSQFAAPATPPQGVPPEAPAPQEVPGSGAVASVRNNILGLMESVSANGLRLADIRQWVEDNAQVKEYNWDFNGGGPPEGVVDNALDGLVEEGLVVRTGSNRYRLREYTPVGSDDILANRVEKYLRDQGVGVHIHGITREIGALHGEGRILSALEFLIAMGTVRKGGTGWYEFVTPTAPAAPTEWPSAVTAAKFITGFMSGGNGAVTIEDLRRCVGDHWTIPQGEALEDLVDRSLNVLAMDGVAVRDGSTVCLCRPTEDPPAPPGGFPTVETTADFIKEYMESVPEYLEANGDAMTMDALRQCVAARWTLPWGDNFNALMNKAVVHLESAGILSGMVTRGISYVYLGDAPKKASPTTSLVYPSVETLAKSIQEYLSGCPERTGITAIRQWAGARWLCPAGNTFISLVNQALASLVSKGTVVKEGVLYSHKAHKETPAAPRRARQNRSLENIEVQGLILNFLKFRKRFTSRELVEAVGRTYPAMLTSHQEALAYNGLKKAVIQGRIKRLSRGGYGAGKKA